jgi:putative membrane protein
MLPLAYVLAGLAALVHVYIFRLESLAWTDVRTRAVFGTTAETAEITRPMAYNQGFYNLFLALVTLIGVVVSATGSEDVGAALMYAGCGSMVAAALVLATSDRSKLRPALIQGVAPTLAVIALLVAGTGE